MKGRKLRDMSVSNTVTVQISKTKTKRLTAGEKSGRNLIYWWRRLRFWRRFWSWRWRRLRTKRRKTLARSKSFPRRPPCCLLRLSCQRNARAILTLPPTLRSSAIIWKQLSLRSSAICDLRSAIVCDHMETRLKIWIIWGREFADSKRDESKGKWPNATDALTWEEKEMLCGKRVD